MASQQTFLWTQGQVFTAFNDQPRRLLMCKTEGMLLLLVEKLKHCPTLHLFQGISCGLSVLTKADWQDCRLWTGLLIQGMWQSAGNAKYHLGILCLFRLFPGLSKHIIALICLIVLGVNKLKVETKKPKRTQFWTAGVNFRTMKNFCCVLYVSHFWFTFLWNKITLLGFFWYAKISKENKDF